MKRNLILAYFIFISSLLPIATLSAMEEQVDKDYVRPKQRVQTRKEEVQTLSRFAFYQELFCLHVERHKELIHADMRGEEGSFNEQLAQWLKGLEYWKKEAMLLRADPENSHENLIKFLYDLPHHYSLLKVLAKSKDAESFEEILMNIIKNQWSKGTHFTPNTTHINIYEGQRRALQIIKDNFRGLLVEYKTKLEKVKNEPILIVPTLELLKGVLEFGDNYKDFMDHLERERIDFVCLCQLLFPAIPEPIHTPLERVYSLVQEFESALELCTTSPTHSITAMTDLQESDDSDFSTKPSTTTPRTPKKVSLQDQPPTTEKESTPTPRNPSPRKDKGFFSYFKFGSNKKSESDSHALPLKANPQETTSTPPKKYRRSSSSGALLGTPNAKMVDPLPFHPLPTPLPELIPDSPTRKETKAPRRTTPKPLDLSKLTKKDGGKISSPRTSPSGKSKSNESPKDSPHKKADGSLYKRSGQ